MIQDRKSKKGAAAGLIFAAVVLVLVVLLENLSSLLPSVPAVLQPTSHAVHCTEKGGGLLPGGRVHEPAQRLHRPVLPGAGGLHAAGRLYLRHPHRPRLCQRFGVLPVRGSAVPFSLPDLFGGVDTPAGLILGVLLAILLGGCVAALFAWLIGLPVLRLKSDYLAIATLGFAEIIRAVFQWQALGPVTNGANMITQIPSFNNFNLTDGSGKVFLRLSTFFPFLIAILCIIVIVMLINSSYGRAFKAIREDEIAAEAMGINLAKHKMLSFCISSFFAGVGGALFAMFVNNAQAKVYTSTMTYEILLIVVIGGIGSISGSCLATFLYVACAEWWLRFLDSPMTFTSVTDTRRILFILVFAALVIGGALLLIRRERRTTKKVWKELLVSLASLALLVWLAFFIISGSLTVPLLRTGFRMVVFSVIIMIVVLFFRRGIMGDKEFSDILFARRKASGKGAVK